MLRLERPTGTKGAATLRQRGSLFGTGWSVQRYQWKPKAPVEKSGVLSRGQWSRLRGTDWETGAFGLSQPVPKARFLVVRKTGIDLAYLDFSDFLIDLG